MATAVVRASNTTLRGKAVTIYIILQLLHPTLSLIFDLKFHYHDGGINPTGAYFRTTSPVGY